MGAGTQRDHQHQDAGEKYVVYQMQKLAVSNGTALTDSYEEEKLDFENYFF